MVGNILALVRVSNFSRIDARFGYIIHRLHFGQDEIGNEDSVQLSEYCFNMCEALKIVTQGVYLSEFMRTKLEELERCVG